MLTKRTKTIGILAASFFVLSTTILTGFSYYLHRQDVRLSEQKVRVAQVQHDIAELTGLSRLIEASAAERQELDSYLLHDDQVIDFLSLIEQLGAEQGATLRTTTLETEELDGSFSRLKVGVSVSGTYRVVTRVLDLFEHLPYQSHVAKVSLVQNIDGSWDATLLIIVTTYKNI